MLSNATILVHSRLKIYVKSGGNYYKFDRGELRGGDHHKGWHFLRGCLGDDRFLLLFLFILLCCFTYSTDELLKVVIFHLVMLEESGIILFNVVPLTTYNLLLQPVIRCTDERSIITNVTGHGRLVNGDQPG